MTKFLPGKTALSAVAALLTLMAGGSAAVLLPNAAEAGNERGHLYSTAAVNRICGVAQQIVASTALEVNNSIFTEWTGFVQSDAAPYSVVAAPGPLPWNPPEEPDLPLTSTQHVIYGLYDTGNRDYPQVVSCKMKNAEYLVEAGLDTSAVDQTCQAVHQYYVGEVVASLTNPEQAQYVMEPDAEFEPDAQNDAGPFWTAGFPDNPYPVLYRESEGGPVHIKASRLLVPAYPGNVFIPFPPPGNTLFNLCTFTNGGLPGGTCEPRKWGVRYCHLAAPEYIREALTGGVEVPIIPGGP